jgi:hypothetical protein
VGTVQNEHVDRRWEIMTAEYCTGWIEEFTRHASETHGIPRGIQHPAAACAGLELCELPPEYVRTEALERILNALLGSRIAVDGTAGSARAGQRTCLAAKEESTSGEEHVSRNVACCRGCDEGCHIW